MMILAIFLATAASWGIGAIYYSLLAKPWMEAAGLTKEDIENGGKLPYLISFIAQLVSVFVLYHMFYEMGVTALWVGFMGGAGVGFGFSSTWIFINNAYEGKSLKLSLINSGYAILGLGVAGVVLAVFM